MSESSTKPIVIFDGSCDFCTACIQCLRFLDWYQRLEYRPFQEPQLPQEHGLTVEQCEQSVWLIMPDGKAQKGALAISTIFDVLWGVFSLFGTLYRTPGVGQLEEWLYEWIAKNRRYLPGVRPYCQQPGANCGSESLVNK